MGYGGSTGAIKRIISDDQNEFASETMEVVILFYSFGGQL
jgi:hypothetical protein